MSGTNFDYQAASEEARNEWLSDQASDAKRRINKTIGHKYGYFSKTHISDIKTSNSSRLLATMTVDNVEGGWASNSLKHEFRTVFCPTYNKLDLSEHKIGIQFKMKNVEDRAIGNFSISPRECPNRSGND
ncbi:MAG: hypothetical protein L3J02_04515 [Henriciella sp.]|nr:hypothetical protein [Henriciella sp.]